MTNAHHLTAHWVDDDARVAAPTHHHLREYWATEDDPPVTPEPQLSDSRTSS
jgi:hypothetical protein